MRKIDYDKQFSEDDVAWLRSSGVMSEEAIAAHQEKFGADIPEGEVPDDTVTRSALDPSARLRGEFVGSESAPVNTSPEAGSIQAGDAVETDDGDDYDSWKIAELREEVDARNNIAASRTDVTEVTVLGTGADGNVRKPDLIKGLRVWDDENPGVLDAEAERADG